MKKEEPKKTLHPRNPHNQRYDFEQLINSLPELKEFVQKNKYDDLSIDFSNAKAVLTLNKALLANFYGITQWQIPEDYLCPPIPGRADYIHYLADLLAASNKNEIPKKNIRGLDIGTGANCIYPIIGSSAYDWSFVASDIDLDAIKNAQLITSNNRSLSGKITTIHQEDSNAILDGIIMHNDRFDFTICNPPFHKSKKEAKQGSQRKVSNLSKGKTKKVTLNFGGKSNELWCQGGEVAFVSKMIQQSQKYQKNVCWFTSLVSKKENLDALKKELKKVNPAVVKIVEMTQGNKVSRFIAWSFLSQKEQLLWFKNK